MSGEVIERDGQRPLVALGRRQLLYRLSRGSAEQLTGAVHPVN